MANDEQPKHYLYSIEFSTKVTQDSEREVRMNKTQSNPLHRKQFVTPSALSGLSSPAPTSSCGLQATSATDTAALRLNVYDFFAHLGKNVINPGGLDGRDRLLAELDIKPGSRVLEIGCGSGHTACYLAQRFQCQVTAVDLSVSMIRAARQRVAEAGLDAQVRCEIADICWLPFAGGSFDYVIIQAVLMFVDKTRALGEIRRVLRPGGQLGAIEFAWHQPPPAEVRDDTHKICGCSVLEFHTRDEWAGWLQRLNYQHIEAEEHPFALLSILGFIRDEGVINCLRILGRIFLRRDNVRRLAQIWGHFARHRAHFRYALLTACKMR